MRRKLTAALLTAAMAISLPACGGSGDTASAGASTGETASVTGGRNNNRFRKRSSPGCNVSRLCTV